MPTPHQLIDLLQILHLVLVDVLGDEIGDIILQQVLQSLCHEELLPLPCPVLLGLSFPQTVDLLEPVHSNY